MSAQEKTMIGVIGVREAEILASKLAVEGIEIQSVYSHASCKSGCSPSKEIWAHAGDIPAIQQIMRDDHLKTLAEMGVDPNQVHQVFDPLKPTAICPACGVEFQTSATECPDCGLGFG